MNDLNQLVNHSEGDKQDQQLKKAISQMLDLDLKKEITQSLQEEYNISRSNPEKRENKTLTSGSIVTLKRLSAIAAVFLICFAAYFLLTSKTNTLELANQYAYHEVIAHPGLLKGEGNPETNRNDAVQSFNQQRWSEAIHQFQNLEPQSAESTFYTAMAMFYAKDYKSAISTFQSELLHNSIYNEEIKWYLGLSYILDHHEIQGKQALQEIKKGEWNYELAKTLLR